MAISDDVIYGGLLILSIPFGHFIKITEGPQKKRLFSTLAGFLIVLSVSGVHIAHSLITTLVNCLIIKILGPKRCHIASFIWCFGYILFFRMSTYFGLPAIPPHSNAVQLVMTLKLVGIAFEVHDSNKKEAPKTAPVDEIATSTTKLEKEYQHIDPSILDMLMYSYCYIGILTGPYYKYRTYYDMLHEKNTKNINTLTPLIHKLKWLPLYALSFIGLSKFFSIQYVLTDQFYENPFWFRLIYMVPMFFIFRLRFYCAWYLAESMCVTAALGAYPAISKPRIGKGPTNLPALKQCEKMAPEGINYNFETVRNISPYGCEFAPTVREGMKSWNMTVQYWMASVVYKSLPFKSSPLKAAITMFVSAFWHGIYPGYYLSFLTTIPSMLAEDLLAAAFKHGKSPRQQQIFDGLCWFLRCRSLDYMCMPFLLLTLHNTMRYWASIYFAAHVWTVFLIIIGYLCAPQKRLKKE